MHHLIPKIGEADKYFPSEFVAAAVERHVAALLPSHAHDRAIDSQTSEKEWAEVVERQRAAFAEKHGGDPFGSDLFFIKSILPTNPGAKKIEAIDTKKTLLRA